MLARKYHPDVAEDKEAGDEKFKELNEAYSAWPGWETRSFAAKSDPQWPVYAAI